MINKEDNKRSILETVHFIQSAYRYLLSKWYILLIAGIIGAIGGISYAWLQKPEYIAEITFAPETESGGGMGMYSGLAAQFGIDMGGSSGGAFEGDNLSEFLKSKMLIEKTLFTPVEINKEEILLINYFIEINKNNNSGKYLELKNIKFSENYQPGNRFIDSVLTSITDNISKLLVVDKKDKKLNIIAAKIKNDNELFAKLFIENLVNTGITYYINYKSGKSKQNVRILQKQADSVKNLLTGNIVSIAATNDLNINPLRQIVRAGTQRKQVDVQVNGQLYGELVKQLELSKISLRRETPFIQIIDTPRLPLDKKKLGRLKAGIIFGLIAGFLTLLVLIIKFSWRNYIISLKSVS